MEQKTYNCVVCGKEFTGESTKSERFCSRECLEEYVKSQKKKPGRKKKEQDEKFGSAPDEYAEKQKEKTLAMLPPIVNVPDETAKRENMSMSEAESVLVYMKGRIEGAIPFCQDEAVTDLLNKLLNGVNTLIEWVEGL